VQGVAQSDVKRAIETAEAHGFEAWDVGGIETGQGGAEVVVEHVGPAASW
jgi:hypothetical protein